jgi:hypothetical protein
LKRLTFLLQNPQCCFVYYLVFKDQAADATDLAPYPNRINLSRISFKVFFEAGALQSRLLQPEI